MTTKIIVIVAALAVVALIIGGVLVLGNSSKTTQSSPSPSVSSKLEVTDTLVGTGAVAKEGDSITVKYTGK
ncbi:hypothetical protein ACTGXS_10970, partial [Streptococcus suis]